MIKRYREPLRGLIEQTSILRNTQLPQVEIRNGEGAVASFSEYPWLLVLTQDCDLQFDRLARQGRPVKEGGNPVPGDKILRSILLCPAFLEEHVLAGTYLDGAKRWGSNEKKILLTNRDDRYHRLPSEEGALPNSLVLDFKLVVASHPEYLHDLVRMNPDMLVATMNPPFRDRLMQRFVNYFGRVAEPDEE